MAARIVSGTGQGSAAGAYASAAQTVVQTSAGSVEGVQVDGVVRFLAIPYGASTAGANRFRAPQPPVPWRGVRAAIEPAPLAPQLQRLPAGVSPRPMSEDCLMANVWTPSTTGRRPVLFWMHGGGFIIGDCLQTYTDGANLARRGDVVVVSVHHRLGLLGFLHLEELGGANWGATQNASIRDLIAALRWVQENIAAFGGDPGSVTIFGHSGGGGKVAAVMTAADARGLFHKACVLGGPPFGFKVPDEATRTAELALDRLGLTAQSSRALQDVPLKRLLEVQAELGAGSEPGRHGMRFAPIIGTESIPAFPVESFAAGVSRDVPLLTGTALDEMRYTMQMKTEWRRPDFDIDEATLRRYVGAGVDNGDQVTSVVEHYRSISHGASRFELMLAILSDQFRIRTLRLADAKASGGAAPVYSYLCATNQDAPMRAFHSIEVPLFFHNVGRSDRHPSGPAAEMGQRLLSEALVSFARDGELSSACGWPAYRPESQVQLLVTDDGAEAVSRPYPERLAAWEGVITSARTDPWGVAFS